MTSHQRGVVGAVIANVLVFGFIALCAYSDRAAKWVIIGALCLFVVLFLAVIGYDMAQPPDDTPGAWG